MTQKQNIIFIFPDQHRGNAMGCINPAVITPNLDKLAAEGVLFNRCLTNSPLCMPARSSMMSGQYVSQHGCWNNNRGSDADAHGPSHVRSIRDAGYHTAIIGKDHLVHFPVELAPGATNRRQWYRDIMNEGWGFDEPFITHTSMTLARAIPKMPPKGEPSYPQILEAEGLMKTQREYMIEYLEKAYNPQGGESRPWEDPPCPVPAKYHLDSYIGQKTVNWIENYNKDKPFSLQVNFPGPHDPFDSPQEYRDLYRLEDMPVGKLERPSDPIAPYVQATTRWANIRSMTEEQYKQGCINYYSLVTLIDEQIGKIIKALEEKGIADNTWIIYNSDHGEMLGDHYLRHKIVFYDEAVNVPCIIRPPGGVEGWRSEALVETIDMSATMLDIAGAGMDDGLPGTSLKDKVLSGPDHAEAQKGKEYVFSEVAGFSMIRDDRYKFAVALNTELTDVSARDNFTGNGREEEVPVEMYDLQEDPNEYKNVVNDPAYKDVQDRLMGAMKEHLDKNLDREKLMKVLSTPSDGQRGA